MRETVNSRPTTAAFANPDADPSAFDEDAQRVGDTVCKVIGPDGTAQPITVPSTGLLPITRAPLKRPLTLDLNAKLSSEGGTNIKRLRFTGNANGAPVPVLSTPDLQILKMASPELEKFMMDNNSLQTPTPSLLCPSKVNKTTYKYIFRVAIYIMNLIRLCRSPANRRTMPRALWMPLIRCANRKHRKPNILPALC